MVAAKGSVRFSKGEPHRENTMLETCNNKAGKLRLEMYVKWLVATVQASPLAVFKPKTHGGHSMSNLELETLQPGHLNTKPRNQRKPNARILMGWL